MSLLKLPEIRAEGRASVRCEVSPRALERWNPSLQARDDGADNSISVLDVIGQDFWTGEGVTAKRIAAALRSIGPDKPVTVNVNSPGGDMFEGIAIYNMLREHQGPVTVKVLGLAASAASLIAMAGDTIEIGRPAFFMIHNASVGVWGNRHDLRDAADWMEPFDAAMADVYAARTGIDLKAVQKMLDAETWIGGSNAVEQGFADSLLASEQIKEGGKASASAVRRMEAALRASGLPRSEAQRLITEFKASLSDSAGDRGLSDSAATEETAAVLRATINQLRV